MVRPMKPSTERIAVVVISPLENQSSRWPRSSVTSRQPSASATNRNPQISKWMPFRVRLARSSFITRGSQTSNWTRMNESAPIGTLIRKIQCQLMLSVITPPSVGPNTGPQTTTKAKAANAMPRCCGGKVSASIDCSTGASPPPPMPWNTRARISMVRFGAIPQSSDEIANNAIEIRKYRFRPIVSESQPEIGMIAALATR